MKLIQRTRDEVRATIAALSPEVRTQLSTEWLALLESSSEQDPWIHGFCIVNDDGVQVGLGSFKGPPVDGIVEIAYAVAPKYQGNGYATAAARALAAQCIRIGSSAHRACAHITGWLRFTTRPDQVRFQQGRRSRRVRRWPGLALRVAAPICRSCGPFVQLETRYSAVLRMGNAGETAQSYSACSSIRRRSRSRCSTARCTTSPPVAAG